MVSTAKLPVKVWLPVTYKSPEKYPFFQRGLSAPIEYKSLVSGNKSESKVMAATRLTLEIKFLEKANSGLSEL